MCKMPLRTPQKRCLVCLGSKTTKLTKRLHARIETALQIAENSLSPIHLCVSCLRKLVQIDRLTNRLYRSYQKNKAEYWRIESQHEEHSYSTRKAEAEKREKISESLKRAVSKRGIKEEVDVPQEDATLRKKTHEHGEEKEIESTQGPTGSYVDQFSRESSEVLDLPCPICDASYVLGHYLTKHIKQWHWKEKDGKHICVHCKKEFTSTEKLLPHARQHRKDMRTCNECPLVFTNWGQILEHKAAVHFEGAPYTKDGIIYKCDECKEVAETKSLLSYHKLRIHGKTAKLMVQRPKHKFPCPYCKLSFPQELKLEKHLSVHGKTGGDFLKVYYGELENMPSDEDNEEHTSSEDATTHEPVDSNKENQISEPPIREPPANPPVEDDKEASFDASPVEENQIVLVSTKSQSAKKPAVRERVKVNKRKKRAPRTRKQRKKNAVKAVCGCGESFDSHPLYKQHRLDVHGGYYICGFPGCGRTFLGRNSIARHRYLHFPKSLECEICGIKCKSQQEFDLHKQQFHSVILPETNIPHTQTPGLDNQEEESSMEVENIENPSQDTPKKTLPESEDQTGESPCPICDATYVRDCYLSRHLEQFHWKCVDDKIVCPTCDESFTDFSGILPHARGHRKDLQACTDCSLVFPNWSKMFDHKKTAHVDGADPTDETSSYTCNVCQEATSSKSLLSYHRLLVHGLTTKIKLSRPKHKFPCQLCDLSFPQKLKLDKHKLFHSGRRHLPEGFKQMCDLCYNVFPDVESKAEHYPHCAGPSQNNSALLSSQYPCCICDALFEHMGGVEQHIVTTHWAEDPEGLRCAFCNEVFPELAGMVEHARLHRSDMVPCKKCPDTVFALLSQLTNHNQNFHTNAVVEKTNFTCPCCDEEAGTRSLLAYHHLLSHGQYLEFKSDSKIHICPVCKRTFATYAYLRRHLMTHARVKQIKPRYQCSNCRKSFNVQVLLDKHISEGECAANESEVTATPSEENGKRKEARTWLCTQCGKVYKHKESYKHHMAEHTGVAAYKCAVCDRKFGSRAYFKRHMMAHKKSYVCSQCGARFGLSSHLKDHELTHSNRRDWICEVCGEAFRWRISMLAHLAKTHAIGKPQKPNPQIIICTLCNTRMTRKNLSRHFKVCHPTLKCSSKYARVVETPVSSEGKTETIFQGYFQQPGMAESSDQPIIISSEMLAEEEHIIHDNGNVQLYVAHDQIVDLGDPHEVVLEDDQVERIEEAATSVEYVSAENEEIILDSELVVPHSSIQEAHSTDGSNTVVKLIDTAEVQEWLIEVEIPKQ